MVRARDNKEGSYIAHQLVEQALGPKVANSWEKSNVNDKRDIELCAIVEDIKAKEIRQMRGGKIAEAKDFDMNRVNLAVCLRTIIFEIGDSRAGEYLENIKRLYSKVDPIWANGLINFIYNQGDSTYITEVIQ